ncbi:MAG TPA: hypothetical protein VNT58_03905 [Gaiellaceae bacterium]|nr:hypothetical protein [Gaiellaceae bacterium]
MKKVIAAFAMLAALTLASSAGAVDFGANDDTGKYSADGGTTFFGQMKAANLKQNVMTVRWTPGSSEIRDQGFLDNAVPKAVAAGITPMFAVYPYPPSAIESGGASPAAFGEWLRAVAARYPQVRTYIVGNEPNLNTFWRPQGDGAGAVLSGASFGPFLAAGYDALKAVSPGITVLGVGSSPRGERAPGAAGKSSPVHFLHSLGQWYRASGRPTRLMDGFSFHPYPNPSDFTVPFSFTYGWPNASVHELPRIKQALWDAFGGTSQPTTLNGLKLYLDEVGWQVATEGNAAYTGSENVKVTTEANQAQIYDALIRYVVCDPDVAQLNFFGYWDERDRGGWQSALRRADGSERASNAAVAAAISATGGSCQGQLRTWSPLSRPDGAAVTFSGAPKSKGKGKARSFGFVATASEDVTVKAGVVPASTPKDKIAALLADAGTIEAKRNPPKSVSATASASQNVVAVLLSAKLNPSRTALFLSPPFAGDTTGAPAKAKPKAKAKKK